MPKKAASPLGLKVLFLPVMGILAVIRAIFFPPKRKKPIGYWARDRHGRWELRIPAYSKEEKPPYL